MLNSNQRKILYKQKLIKFLVLSKWEIMKLINCPTKNKFLINDKNFVLEFSSTEKIFE